MLFVVVVSSYLSFSGRPSPSEGDRKAVRFWIRGRRALHQAKVEALLLATRGGLDPARALEAIGAGAAASWQLNNLGPKIIARDYRPGFLIKLLRKDLRLVSEAARETGTPLPALSLVSAFFDAASTQGHALDGTQALAAMN